MTIGRRPDPATTPVIIIVRDRLEPLQLLVAWLERAGARHLVLLDNDSTCWGETWAIAHPGCPAWRRSWGGAGTMW